MTTATQSEFAALLGKDKSYVTRLKQAGRLVMVGEGRSARVDVEATHALLARTADPSRADVVAARDAQKGRAPLPPVDADIQHADDQQPGSRAHFQRIALQYDNGLTKLLLGLKRGTRFWRKSVRREPRSVGEMPRAGIERMIDQLHARMTVARDDDQRRALVAAEVRRIKRAVKKEAVRALRRMGRAGAEKIA